MPAITEPNLGLHYGWETGESGWSIGMDANLKRLGAVVSLAVKDRDLTAPPESVENGDRYLIAANATGIWSGKTGQIAVWVADVWEYYIPRIGWLCFIEDEAVLSAYKTTGWSSGIAL